MEIIALKQYTDKYVSLYEGEIRNLNDIIAQKLIEQSIVAEHDDSDEQQNIPEVEFIHIGEIGGTFGDKLFSTQSNYRFYSGGNGLKNNQNLYQLIGDKKILGVVASFNQSYNNSNSKPIALCLNWVDMNINKDISLLTVEERKQITSMTIKGIVDVFSYSTGAQPLSGNVYLKVI